MTGPRAIFLTARREVRERARSRAFLISTGLQILVVVAIVVVASITSDETDEFKVGAVGPDAVAITDEASAAAQGFAAKLDVEELAEADARRQVEEGDLDAAVLGNQTVVTGSGPSETLTALLSESARSVAGAQSLRDRGLDDKAIRDALAPEPIEVEEVGDESGSGVAFVASLLLYIAIISFGIAVAIGVVEEKATRVVEVILSAIRPIHLLSGKVLGIGLLGLGQVLLVAGAGLATALVTNSVDLPDSTALVAVLVAVYFVLGYLVYASMYAISGAMVSRQEDVNSSSAPLTTLLVAAYLVGVSASDDPDSSLAVVSTFVPPLAPMIVPSRAAQDSLPAGELAISIVLMIAATAALLWVAARIYDRAVLHMGAPLKLRDALRLARRER